MMVLRRRQSDTADGRMAGKGGRRRIKIGPEGGRGPGAWGLVVLCMMLCRENCRHRRRTCLVSTLDGNALVNRCLGASSE